MNLQVHRLILTGLAAVAVGCHTADGATAPPPPAGPAWAWNLPVYETALDLATPHGTFREFEQRLDALQDLGVGIIWFLPIFPTGGNPPDKPRSNSAYCVRDYCDVNPRRGTKEEFKHLVAAIRARGMRVVMDWVSFVPALAQDGRVEMDKMGQAVSPLDVVRNGNRQLHGVTSGLPSPYQYHLDFSTYFGGSDGEYLRGMDVDAQGNVYVAGTLSDDGPTTPGVYQRKGGRGWVAKFSPNGALIWSTHFGDGVCTLFSVKVDKAGFVYVSGNNGPRLPVTAGVFQPTYGGTGNSTNQCGFVAKLKPDASGVVWASYVGNGYSCRDMTMDDEGSIYCDLAYDGRSKYVLPAGWFAGAYCKTPHGAAGGKGHFGASDCGLIKISNDGSKVIWATWLGGSGGNDWVASVDVGADHCPVVMLNTYSTDMPTTPGAFCKTPSLSWVGKLSADGSKLLMGTYTGVTSGTPFARTHNVALDHRGNIFIAFQAHSCPVTPGAFQRKCRGQDDFAIEKISPSGALLAATFIGGSGLELNGPDQITVDRKGNVVIVGCTSSTDYPVTSGAFQPKNGGAGGKYPFDGVVSILSDDLRTLLYSTYIGGGGDEMARACAVGPDGTLYVGGVTTSKDFPTKNAYQRTYAGDPGFGSVPNGGSSPVGWGNGDNWLAKFSLLPLGAPR